MDLIGQGKQPDPKLSAWKVLLKTLWANGKAGLSTGRALWGKRLDLKED
jgi:FMN oxidoreductase